jgi:hypothetical protein
MAAESRNLVGVWRLVATRAVDPDELTWERISPMSL